MMNHNQFCNSDSFTLIFSKFLKYFSTLDEYSIKSILTKLRMIKNDH